MLHVVTPKNRQEYQNMVSQMFAHRCLETLELVQLQGGDAVPAVGCDTYDTPEAVYLIYIDDVVGLCGSARLLPSKMSMASKECKDYLNVPLTDMVWECSQVCFHVDPDHPLHEDGDKFRTLAGHFYQSLYEGLEEFGNANGIDYIFTINDEEGHEDLRYFGCFPFKYQSSVTTPALGAVKIGILLIKDETHQRYLDKRTSFWQSTEVA